MTDDDISLYGSAKWVAARLGVKYDRFLALRKDLEDKGFPKRDAIINLYLKADVDAWIFGRRRIADDRAMLDSGNQPREPRYENIRRPAMG